MAGKDGAAAISEKPRKRRAMPLPRSHLYSGAPCGA